MQITDITIRPTNEHLVRAYVDIIFDNCFMVGEMQSHSKALRDFSSHFQPRS
jgi:DNA-binding cell septation regulator SpoVG